MTGDPPEKSDDEESTKKLGEFTGEFEDIDDESEFEFELSTAHEERSFEELPNLHISRHLDVYKDDLQTDPVSRPRGILSSTDRDYLYGLKDYAHNQSEANRRQEIRERIKSSLKDFKILWARLDEKDREQIFADLTENEVNESIEAIMTFFYLGIEQEVPRLEQAIGRGLLAGENVSKKESSVGEAKKVDVSIEIGYYPDADAVEEKLETAPLDELTVEELGVLAKSGKLEPDDISKLNDSEIYVPSGYFGHHDDQPVVDKDPVNYDVNESKDQDPENESK